MIRALWTSASGMIAQQLNLDVTANNASMMSSRLPSNQRSSEAELSAVPPT